MKANKEISVTIDLKDNRGCYRTRSLFWEMIGKSVEDNGYEPIWTLKDKEHKGLLSLKQIYMSYEDPTEYDFATGTFGSWTHWKYLCEITWFKPHVQNWRDEAEIRMRSKAIKAMTATALNEGSKGTSAARYIAEKGWEKQAGRPSKENIKRREKIEAGINSEVNDDASRLGIIKH